MTREQLIDAMARAIFEHWQFQDDKAGLPIPWTPGGNSLKQDEARDYATVALTAIEAAGMVVVPAIPTKEMVEAGWIDKEDVNPDEIYIAMIASRPSALSPAPSPSDQ